jgi:hypothetical protein
MVALKDAADPEDARLRLRASLRRMTEVIMLLVVPRGHDRLCAVQFHFKEGARREYLVLYRPAAKPFGKPRPARVWRESLARIAKPGKLDLRKPADAQKLEKWLAAENVEDLAAAMPTLKTGGEQA